MGKATLEFDLPEEYEEFQDAVKGADYKFVLFQSLQRIRKDMESCENDDVYEGMKICVDILFEELESRNLEI